MVLYIVDLHKITHLIKYKLHLQSQGAHPAYILAWNENSGLDFKNNNTMSLLGWQDPKILRLASELD